MTEGEVISALRVLFSSKSEMDGSMLKTLQASHIERAYLKEVLAAHPGRYAARDKRFLQTCSRRFMEARNAYATLNAYVKFREEKRLQSWQDPRKEAKHAGGHRDFQRRRTKSSSQHGSPASQSHAGFFWPKPPPERPLRIGEYLFYSGVIPWHSLKNAIAWQRTQRPRLGEIAQKWRWLSESQIGILLPNLLQAERLGEALVHCGLITSFQLRVLLAHQQRVQQPLGRFFVYNEHLSEAQIKRYLQRQQMHNLKFAGNHSRVFSSR